VAEKTEKLHVDDEASTKEAAEDEFGLFAGKKKKKKKKKKIDEEALEEAAKEDVGWIAVIEDDHSCFEPSVRGVWS